MKIADLEIATSSISLVQLSGDEMVAVDRWMDAEKLWYDVPEGGSESE